MSALLANYLPKEELTEIVPLSENIPKNKKTLLLVDDDPVILATLKKQAEAYFSDIYCFESAEHATMFVKNTVIVFDTVLIDYFLPGDSGKTIVSSIKKNESTKIYLMTGDLSSVPLKDVKDFDACLPKPLRNKRIKEIFSF